MDTSRISTGQMIAAVGGAVLIISLFLDWVSGVSLQIGGASVSSSASAWDVFSGMDIIMLLIGVAAIAPAVMAVTGSASGLTFNPSLVVAVLGVVAFGWALGWDLENPNAGFGAWLALFAAGAIAYGAFRGTREAPAAAVRSTPTSAAPTSPAPPTA
jgi:hypothetical protein